MNKKGQMGIGIILMAFVSIIVAIALFMPIAQSVGGMRSTDIYTNQTVTLPADGEQVALSGQSASSVVITNSTSGATVPSTNYTVSNKQVVNGELTALLTTTTSDYAEEDVYVSYVSEPDGYVTGASSSIAYLIVVMSALAIGVIAIELGTKGGLSSLMGM